MLSLCRGHADLCIVPLLVCVLLKRACYYEVRLVKKVVWGLRKWEGFLAGPPV